MEIFVGFDLSGNRVEYYAENEQGKMVSKGGMPWSPKQWEKWIESLGKPEEVTVAFETSPEAYRAQAILEKLGVRTYPFHAAHFPAVYRTKKKTDPIDAEKIGRNLRVKNLPRRVVLPESGQAVLRNLITERELMVNTIRRWVLRVRGLARQWDVSLPRYSRDTAERWWEGVKECFGKEQRKQVCRGDRMALVTLQSLEELEEEIEKQIEMLGYREHFDRLQTLPGIGSITAAALLSYLGDGSRFTSGRKVASYVGLVPSLDKSGKQSRYGHITKEGPAALRRLLVLAAHSASQSKELDRTRWGSWFRSTAKRRGRKMAIVGLARKMLVASYALLRDETTWNPDQLRQRAA